MVRMRQEAEQLAGRVTPAGLRDVALQARHGQHGSDPHDHPQAAQQVEGGLPPVEVAQEHPERHARDRGQRKCRHHGAGGRASPGIREHVADHREDQGTEHAPERARDHARRHQHVVTRRKAARKRPQREARDQRQQRRLAIESVDHQRGQEPGHAGAERVRRHDPAELVGRDVQRPLQQRAERHHDHEIHDVGQLDRRQDDEQGPLPGGRPLHRGGLGHRRGERILGDFHRNQLPIQDGSSAFSPRAIFFISTR